MWKHVIEKLITHALESAVGALGIALLPLLFLTENYLAQYAQALTPLTTVRIIVALLSVTLLTLAYAIYNKPKLKFSQIDGGVWLDAKTGKRFCPSCFAKKIHSPLIDVDDIIWQCPVRDCLMTYRKKIKYP